MFQLFPFAINHTTGLFCMDKVHGNTALHIGCMPMVASCPNRDEYHNMARAMVLYSQRAGTSRRRTDSEVSQNWELPNDERISSV
jgi:hypothetical protein